MIVIVQARMGSTRLPGKVMAPIEGKPLLSVLLERLSIIQHAKVVLSTSDNAEDDVLDELGRSLGIRVFRGKVNDVASRFLHAALELKAESFARISGDSPLLDPSLVTQAFDEYLSCGEADIVTNVFPRSFPRGQSVEVIRTQVLARHLNEMNSHQREHVTQYFYSNHDKFTIRNFSNACGDQGQINLSVDTDSDLARVRVTARSLGFNASYQAYASHLEGLG